MRIYIDAQVCKGCGLCIHYCPREVLRLSDRRNQKGYTIAEVSCPTRYFPEASSINFRRSLRYGLGCVWTALMFRSARMELIRSPLFPGKD